MGLIPSPLNDPTVHFFGAFLHITSLITKPNPTAYIPHSPPASTVHFIGWCGSPSPQYGTPPYIVDCLHIWPLPRGRIYLGWHQCILAVRSFWYVREKEKTIPQFLFDLIYVQVNMQDFFRNISKYPKVHLYLRVVFWATSRPNGPTGAVLFLWRHLSLEMILCNYLAMILWNYLRSKFGNDSLEFSRLLRV